MSQTPRAHSSEVLVVSKVLTGPADVPGEHQVSVRAGPRLVVRGVVGSLLNTTVASEKFSNC